MSTIYMSQLSTLPLIEGDQDQGLFPAFHTVKDHPILFPFMISSPMDQHQAQNYGDQHLRQQFFAESNQQFNDHMKLSGSDVVFPTPSPFQPTIQSIGSHMIQRSTYDPYDIENKHTNGSTSRWAVAPPAKMKIMRKETTSEYPEGGAARKPRRRAQAHQDESEHQQQQQGIVRVCSDCNTTKTPLWRSGPCGPKSLCNACGIRQRKARRAMAAAAAAAAARASNGGSAATVSTSQETKQAKKEKRAEVDRSLPFKKRCKMVTADQAATAAKAAITSPTSYQDHVVTGDSIAAAPGLQSKGTPPAMFHADEITNAAMLLMTLSCGLVRN